MGVGLYRTGRYNPPTGSATPEGALGDLQAWIEEHGGEPVRSAQVGNDHDGQPTLFVSLHASAEDVRFTLPEPGRIAVSGKTSSAGPGYHIYVCDLLHRFGEVHAVTWDPPEEGETGDQTSYFHSGDAVAVQEAMLHWLASMGQVVLENLQKDRTGFMVAMPLGHHYPYHGPVVTPLGPRDRAWFEALAEDPWRGSDFFAWWEPGLNASYYLGKALADMWAQVRWRTPLLEVEAELLLETHLNLQRAYRLDPALDYPWREWQELLGYIEEYYGDDAHQAGPELTEEIKRRVAGMVGGPRLGYRREPVRVDLVGGWDIEIPGAMAEEWDDKGQSWSAWDGKRTVWFSAFSRDKPDGGRPTAAEMLAGAASLPEGEAMDYRRDGLLGRAVLTPYEEDGEAMWNLKAYAAVAGHLALCNVFFHDLADRDWAVATWHSLNHR
jgi:hypothetical protein